MSTIARHDHRWAALGLLVTSYLMVILDVAIVGVAAPSIKADLGFSQGGLQWIVTGYAMTFGGLLLLGGRAADLLGRRRVFMFGTALFTAASLVCGLAWSPEVLVAARIVQGFGAAIITPAALSIITTTFTEGSERNKALGAWNAAGGVGGTLGLVIGGVLTDSIGWEWLFFINVPVGVAVLLLSRPLLRESRAELTTRRFDLAGALSVTASLIVLVYALVEAPQAGWSSVQTVLLLAAAALLLITFAGIERRSPAPLVPLRTLRRASLAGGNLLGVLAGASIFGWFFIATLYLQQVLGYSPLKAGLAFAAASLGGLLGPIIGQSLATKVGPRPVALIGAALLAVGFLLQRGVDPQSEYVADLLVPFMLMGIGTGFAFVASVISALEGISERESGLASGLINTSQQIGGAIGVAVLSTVAVSRTDDVLGGPSAPQSLAALTEGFQSAYTAAVGLTIGAALVGLLLLGGRRRSTERGPEAPPISVPD
ncbi:MAG: MFS transporter [Gaiellaceae bacterium]